MIFLWQQVLKQLSAIRAGEKVRFPHLRNLCFREYFQDAPIESELRRWATSEWIEYQAWLFHHAFITDKDWHALRQQALSWQDPPLISVITPTYNTRQEHLYECIYSIMTQAYPYWEMCLFDDGSTDKQTVHVLKKLVSVDPRLKLELSPVNMGISHATNRAFKMARGEYVAFLDHDDRLSPDALYYVVESICRNPCVDIMYSDCDMLSPRGLRFMHLFKTDWSPELLFSFNYICHLMVYRRQLVEMLGGMSAELEGSQDYDLILRAAELNPFVLHIPRILYHWRQSEQSIAFKYDSKEYVWKAGVLALQKTIERRGLEGKVDEIPDLWRGNYRVHLRPPLPDTFSVISMDDRMQVNNFSESFLQKFKAAPNRDYLIVLGPAIRPEAEHMFQELVSWFQISEVGIVTGKILDAQGCILHAGLVQRLSGSPLSIYEEFPETTPSYMAATSIVRNVSSPHPGCFAIRQSLLDALGGLNLEYCGPHAVLDLAFRALNKGFRIVYTPFARFVCDGKWSQVADWPDADRRYFAEQRASWLSCGDPYYNRWLTLKQVDMGLDIPGRSDEPHD